MERIADSIRDVAGYSVAKAVGLAKQHGTPLLLLPEAFFPTPTSRKENRLAVYAVGADDAFLMRQMMKETADEWLYTDIAYLVYPTGKLFKVRVNHSDVIDP